MGMPSVEPIKVDIDRSELVVTWADDHLTRFGLIELRRRCTCAQCGELRDRGEPIWPKPGVPDTLQVDDAELIGGWGVSLRWNDRHETGIYPWEVLRSWCKCAECG
jgi:DUF971 family protein